MNKNLESKVQVVAEIVEKLKNAESMVVVQYNGITVEEITGLRAQFRNAGVEYVVLKNTLVRRALEEVGVTGFDKELEGPSAFAFNTKDPSSASKIINEFIEKSAKTKPDVMRIKGGVLEGLKLNAAEASALATMPTREELLATLLGCLMAPAANLVGVLSAIPAKLVYTLEAIAKQKQEAA